MESGISAPRARKVAARPRASGRDQQLYVLRDALEAYSKGDFSVRVSEMGDPIVRDLCKLLNQVIQRNDYATKEFLRVREFVANEGRFSERARTNGLAGSWALKINTLNAIIEELSRPLTEVARVMRSVAAGDLSEKVTVPAKGEVLELKETINRMVDQLNAFAAEVTRVAKEVGSEGRLGGQAAVKGVSGTWRDLTENVNMLAGNLTNQVRNIALVATAVANGDLSQKITVEARGEILELKDTLNRMVDQLRAFASEVTRVAKEVGTEGNLGAQAEVEGVAGTWKDLTDQVNALAGNLTNQVRNIAAVTTAVANGDLSQKITVIARGEILELKNTVNTMVDQLRAFASEVTRVAREVGTDGKLGGQAQVPGAAGTWKDLTDNVNQLAGNLTSQVRNIALVTKAVAGGDLSQKITVEARGEILELKETINRMVDQLSSFAAEVTRVAREVGTEGKLGGQANVPGASGTWRDLTDNVNTMASNLTAQVRRITKVVTAVANGDLSQKLLFEAKGEIASLADTINGMTDTLRLFAEQVTTVAREVGIEGKLGGQAKVPGASGTWRDLTDNVNQLAGNLTTQVRAIADVATAVTKGDLTQSITVEAQGEVLQLKDNINQMIENLRNTTITNKEQDWLKSNLAKFSGMMQGQRSIEALANLIMSELTPVVSAQYGAFYVMNEDSLELYSSYAYKKRKGLSNRFALGEGLVGQAAREKKMILVTDVPDEYVHVVSGLGEASPRCIAVLPIVFEGDVKGVVELGSFQRFSDIHIAFLEQLMLSIGVVFNMIGASMRTEELLKELQRSNAELEGRSKELEEKAVQLEVKNNEIARASATLEEKAQELQQISKYKSDFLANMSHELRTPLNSLLILAKMLADNEEGTLNERQVQYAKTIYSSGSDLLALINEILDLSKIEAGKVTLETEEVNLEEVQEFVDRSFRPVADQKALEFVIAIHPNTPKSIYTDSQRLKQILKNLLANAFKFTEKGSVRLDVELAAPGTRFSSANLMRADAVIAFHVSDTGIGIPEDKQKLIWAAFQQADTTTARKFGGTGLGLTISRELVTLLGGEIQLRSRVGEGSTFSLFLPVRFQDLQSRFQKSLNQVSAVSRQLLEKEEPAKKLSGLKAVLVDDDPRGQYAIAQFLESKHVKVRVFPAAQEAIDYLRTYPEQCDFVLIDVMLPGKDGFTATKELRTHEALRNLPIVVYSGKSIPGAQEKARECGADAFVDSPSEGATVVDVVLAAIRERRSGHAPKSPERSFEKASAFPASGRALSGSRILLVDDDARNLFAVTSLLEHEGAEVFAVDNAKEGIEIALSGKADLVLMDIMLPEIDGYAATGEIRKRNPEIPVIAVSAKAMRSDREKALAAGCDDFVSKPIDNDRLLSTVKKYLSRKNAESA